MNNNKKVFAIYIITIFLMISATISLWWTRKQDNDEIEYKCLGARVTTLETKTFENLQVARIAQMEREIDMLRNRMEDTEDFLYKLDNECNKNKTTENKLVDVVYSENEWRWIQMGKLPMDKGLVVPFDKKFFVVTNKIDTADLKEWKRVPFGEIEADWYVRFPLPINYN